MHHAPCKLASMLQSLEFGVRRSRIAEYRYTYYSTIQRRQAQHSLPTIIGSLVIPLVADNCCNKRLNRMLPNEMHINQCHSSGCYAGLGGYFSLGCWEVIQAAVKRRNNRNSIMETSALLLASDIDRRLHLLILSRTLPIIILSWILQYSYMLQWKNMRLQTNNYNQYAEIKWGNGDLNPSLYRFTFMSASRNYIVLYLSSWYAI